MLKTQGQSFMVSMILSSILHSCGCFVGVTCTVLIIGYLVDMQALLYPAILLRPPELTFSESCQLFLHVR